MIFLISWELVIIKQIHLVLAHSDCLLSFQTLHLLEVNVVLYVVAFEILQLEVLEGLVDSLFCDTAVYNLL